MACADAWHPSPNSALVYGPSRSETNPKKTQPVSFRLDSLNLNSVPPAPAALPSTPPSAARVPPAAPSAPAPLPVPYPHLGTNNISVFRRIRHNSCVFRLFPAKTALHSRETPTYDPSLRPSPVRMSSGPMRTSLDRPTHCGRLPALCSPCGPSLESQHPALRLAILNHPAETWPQVHGPCERLQWVCTIESDLSVRVQ